MRKIESWLGRHKFVSAIYEFVRRLLGDNIVGIAAQTAFFLLLAIFPIIMLCAGWISRLPLEFDTGVLDTIFPESVADIIFPVIESAPVSTSFTVIQIVIAVWSASSGIWALMRGVCISYTGRTPNFVRGRLISILLMVGFVLMLVLSMAVWVFGQEVVVLLFGDDWQGSAMTITIARYAFTLPLIFLFVLAVYIATPGFAVAKRYMVLGAAFAAVGWTLVSWAFEEYMNIFTNYSALYGGVGAFLGLAVWLLAICFVILIGAELNALARDLAALRRDKEQHEETDN